MADATMLALVKVSLQITTTAMDSYLSQLIDSAMDAIKDEGISLDLTRAVDRQLVIMYVNWLYLDRLSGDEMPRMLRYNLNNRLFKEAIELGSSVN